MKHWYEGTRALFRRPHTGLPEWVPTFDDFLPRRGEEGELSVREALEAVKAWTIAVMSDEVEVPFLTLRGVPGTGKTHLLMASAVEIATELQGDRDDFVLYRTEAELLSELHEAVDEGEGERRFKQFANAVVLVLDDLGAGISSQWDRARIESLVDIRYRHHRPTLVATNYTTAELESLGLARTASRLADAVAGRMVNIRAGDYRKKRQRPQEVTSGEESRAPGDGQDRGRQPDEAPGAARRAHRSRRVDSAG